MKSGVVLSSTLATTGRWDAAYNLAVLEYLRTNGLEETPSHVRVAMAALKSRDDSLRLTAAELRSQARALVEQARKLDAQLITTKGSINDMKSRALRKRRRRIEAEAYAATAQFWRATKSADRMQHDRPVDRKAARELHHKPVARGPKGR